MPLKLWWEAIKTSVYLINRLPTLIINHISPFEKLFKQKPDYDFLKVLKCAWYPHLRPWNKNKLQFHTSKYVFNCYSSVHKGYKCLYSSGRIYIARNVVFNESDFPYKTDESFGVKNKVSNNSSTYNYTQFLYVPNA